MDIYFDGVFYCKADAKGRVMLPVALRNQLAPVINEGFRIKRSYYDDCLELYPVQEWDSVQKELNATSRFDRKHLKFVRQFTAGLRQVEIDDTGRLSIPKDIIALAGITKEVVLASMGKYIEIWDRAKYDESLLATDEEKEELANEVMLREKNQGDVS